MKELASRAHILFTCGAVLIFIGGVVLAFSRWHDTRTDRAFVEAAALAARAPQPPTGVRYWAPDRSGSPGVATRSQIDAVERLRQARSRMQSAPSSLPALPARPTQTPSSGPLPTAKPPATPR